MKDKWYKFKSDPDQFGNWLFLCIILSTIGAIFVVVLIAKIGMYFQIKPPKFIDPVGAYAVSFFGLVMASYKVLELIFKPKKLRSNHG